MVVAKNNSATTTQRKFFVVKLVLTMRSTNHYINKSINVNRIYLIAGGAQRGDQEYYGFWKKAFTNALNKEQANKELRGLRGEVNAGR